MKTLIIIDVQNDFIPGGSLAVPEGDKIVPIINSIQDKFDLIVASQDWHPENHISFASNHAGKKVFDKIEIHGHQQTLWPNHCVQESKGAEFHPDLDTRRIEAIFRKGTDKNIDSYSVFYDNGHLKSTGLTGYLKAQGTSQLYMCGLASDFCVYYSLMDAFKEGFACFFIEDASRPINPDELEKQKAEMQHLGIQIISASDIE